MTKLIVVTTEKYKTKIKEVLGGIRASLSSSNVSCAENVLDLKEASLPDGMEPLAGFEACELSLRTCQDDVLRDAKRATEPDSPTKDLDLECSTMLLATEFPVIVAVTVAMWKPAGKLCCS